MTASYYVHLSRRDRQVIRTINRYKQVTAKHIELLHFQNGTDISRATRVQRVLRRLVKWHEIARIGRPIGGHAGGSGGYIYMPTTSKSKVPNPHTLGITDLMVELHSTDKLLMYEPEPYSHRTVGHTQLKSDAYAEIAVSEGYASVSLKLTGVRNGERRSSTSYAVTAPLVSNGRTGRFRQLCLWYRIVNVLVLSSGR